MIKCEKLCTCFIIMSIWSQSYRSIWYIVRKLIMGGDHLFYLLNYRHLVQIIFSTNQSLMMTCI